MVFEEIESHPAIIDNSFEDSLYKEEEETKVEEIKKAIEKLPDGYRILLSLYLIEGYDHDEISEILSISSSTSRSQLSRARQKLINELQKNM